MQKDFIDSIVKAIAIKKEALIKGRLYDLGFNNAVINSAFSKRRFPVIERVVNGDTEYYFFDNDTPNGLFLIAFIEGAPVRHTDENVFMQYNITFKTFTDEKLVPIEILMPYGN